MTFSANKKKKSTETINKQKIGIEEKLSIQKKKKSQNTSK